MDDRFKRQAAREAAEREQVKGRIAALLTRTPKDVGAWSYNRAADYKKAAAKAQTLLNNPKATVAGLREAEGALTDFHKG